MRAAALSFALVTVLAAACGDTDEDTTVTNTTTVVTPDAQWVDEPLPEDGGADTGAAADAGKVCPPASVPDVSGSWLPRKPARDDGAACDAGQVTAVMSACELDEAACDFSAAYLPCLSCLYGRETDATYSFRTYLPSLKQERLNFRGYALRAGAKETCANAVEDYAACLYLACSCVKVGSPVACHGKAKTGACAAASDLASSACQGHPSEALMRSVIEVGRFDTKTTAVTMAKAFCGGS